MAKQTKAWGKREGKIIVTLFFIVVAFLIAQNVWDTFSPRIFGNSLPVEEGGICGLVYWRNKRIDKMNAEIEKGENCPYTDGDIENAVKCVKEKFKSQKNNINLLKLSYSSSVCDPIRDSHHAAKKFGEKDLIVIMCDFTVFTEGDFSRGTYDGWSVILSRESETEGWKILDEGY